MIKLYFLRHGKTIYNLQEKVQGWNDSPLTEEGIFQARCAGYGLRKTVFTKAYSGDTKRQYDTASYFMRENEHPVDIIADEHFREMNYGKYQDGTYRAMLEPLYRELDQEYDGYPGLYKLYDDFQIAAKLYDYDETRAFEGEERVWQRFKAGLDKVVNENNDGNILISTSSFAIGVVIHKLFPERGYKHLVDNASITIVSYDGSYHLEEYNNINYRSEGEEHLKD